ncbi:PWWP domain-containing protein [Aphelenchoides bicaudatus]|nr:PWWP domain-containing protein [Aphelenchoides bicaudatus]
MADFKIGDLVFAKMRGFPPWPAQIAKTPSTDDAKFGVYFFGTHETAFVRSADLLDYHTNLSTHGVACKRGGFQKALDEIQEVANKKTSEPEASPKKETVDAFSPPGKRQRIPNRLYNDDEFVVPQFRRKHHNSEHNKVQSSPEEAKQNFLNLSGPLTGPLRRRNDSTSSTERSRRRLFSERSGVDLSDIEPTFNTQKILSNGGISLLEGIESEHSEDDALKMFGSTRSRRRTKSRLFDEYFGNNFLKSPRDRSGSLSSTNGRTRLISNVSLGDTFDEITKSFNVNEFMQTVYDFSSEESDRAIVADEPHPASLGEKRCYHCASLCEVWKRKWKCTNKECNRWNGTLEGSGSKKPHPLSHTYSSWDRSFLSDLPVSDSSMNNDPITSMPTEHLANFSAAQSHFDAAPNMPTVTTSADEAVLDQIKEYLLDNNEKKPEDAAAASQSSQPIQTTDQASAQYGFISQNYATKKEGEQVEPENYKQEVYGDLASPPPAVRFEQYMPINKRIIKTTRTKSKVENTPPADANGVRQCIQCPGHVRPQMCGGNKHRWRCVDKRCRKWYGWVKSDDVIPPDLGKKGRWRDLVIRVQSSQNEFEDRRACDMMQNVNPESISLYEAQDAQNRRKYKRKMPSSRNVSPLSAKEKYFGPSQLEAKPRWWLNSDRRRIEASPERNMGTQLLDAAASFRLMGNSMLTAATTKADEYGSMNGALDLVMDGLFSSMAPIFSMTKHIPGLDMPEEVVQRVWNKTTLHTPML